MVTTISSQSRTYLAFYILFGIVSAVLMIYYLSNTIVHFTTPRQFPINSFDRFPLTYLIFPAEIFSFTFAMYFVYNLINGNAGYPKPAQLPGKEMIKIAILIPVYNEPVSIVMRTIRACKKVRWQGGTTVYLLDDSTNVQDRENMRQLSKRFGCVLVHRRDRIGYKAGNINNAVSAMVKEEFFVIFDSDQAPEPEFLNESMDYFSDPDVGFVQTPQHFLNDSTPIERASKMGTNIFFHSQCISKAKDRALPFCGTNAILRTGVFSQVGGFSYYTATEDIELGLRINEAGYYGAFVPKNLVHGYAPTDYNAYSSQQYRWANGNLAILRESWAKILLGKFSLVQQMHAFFTLGWWLIGITTLIYVAVPILSLFAGGTHHTWLPSAILALLFLNVLMGLTMIFASLHNRVDEEKITFSDAILQYSLINNSMFIYSRAAINALLFKKYTGFVRTNKKRTDSGFRHIRWNIAFSAICFGFSVFALYRAAIASDFVQVRTFLPISIWLLFYSLLLGSSIFFVGEKPNPHKAIVPDVKLVETAASRSAVA